jgi:hypothetical protein
VLWTVVVGTLFVFTALGVERKITWYLAVDQYGYLTFAHDLLHGRVFHHWPPMDALAARLPPQVDILSQTYVYDHGHAYCRYAPGFAMLLAAWIGIFGDDGAAYLNPAVYLALLGVALAFQMRVFRARWRAVAGVVLIVLLPTGIDMWSLTLTRDLSTHLSAFLGLYLLLPTARPLTPRRAAGAALALGWAASIRPDAVLYLPSGVLLAVLGWWRRRSALGPILGAAASGALALLVGLTPFLAYNWLATGDPFRPTQGMEIQHFFQPPAATAPPAAGPHVGFPPPAWGAGWHGGTFEAVQGGGLQLRNLPTTLPRVLDVLRTVYGDVLLGLALWGAVLALVRRRTLFVSAVPYTILAVLFFSCWARPDGRYLCGVFVFVPMLIVEGIFGTLDLASIAARTRHAGAGRALVLIFGLGLAGASVLWWPPAPTGSLPTVLGRSTLREVLGMTAPIASAAALAAVLFPLRRVTRVAAPALALGLVATLSWLGADRLSSRARFQRPEMVRARATFAQAVEPNAVVITTEDVGRPAENIDYYSRVARAFYLTDLERWHLPLDQAADLLARGGFHPYLFIPSVQPGRVDMLRLLGEHFVVEVAADVPADKAMDYFVAAAFHRGVHMVLYRLTPGGTGSTS